MNRSVYLALAIVGALVPVALTVGFLVDEGLDFDAMVDPFGEWPALLALADLTISAIAFWVWSARDASRHGITWWPFVPATLLVGLCFALPLYLYVRAGRQGSPGQAAAGAPAAAG